MFDYSFTINRCSFNKYSICKIIHRFNKKLYLDEDGFFIPDRIENILCCGDIKPIKIFDSFEEADKQLQNIVKMDKMHKKIDKIFENL